jgi:hypothetical protein
VPTCYSNNLGSNSSLKKRGNMSSHHTSKPIKNTLCGNIIRISTKTTMAFAAYKGQKNLLNRKLPRGSPRIKKQL